MKVQGLNSSSRKTKDLIKRTFAELIKEKRELNKLTVTELVKRANITRATFYTHYDDIYDVANEYQLETIELLINDKNILYSKEDIINYFCNVKECFKQNEELYKMLLSANETNYFLEKLRKMSCQKIYYALQKDNNDNFLELTVSFFMDGCIDQLLKYLREKTDYSLDEIFINIEKWFYLIFNQ